MPLDRGLLTAREREAFFRFTDTGPYYRLKSFLFGGAGDKDQAKFNEHKHDGRNFVSDTVMVGIDELISGTFSPYYGEMPTLMRNYMGDPVRSEIIDTTYAVNAAGTRRREVFEHPVVGAPAIRTWGIQIADAKFERAKLHSWNMDVTRNTDGGAVTGNASFHCNDTIPGLFPLPNSVAQNEKYTLTANGASGNLGLTYLFPGGAPVAVTMLPTDTALQTKAKFESAGGLTVNVVGAFTAVSEVQSLTTGAGFSAATVPVNVTRLDGTPGTFNVAPGDPLATIGTNASTAMNAAGSVTAGGTSTAATGGTNNTYTVSNAPNTTFNVAYIDNGSVMNGRPVYQNGTGANARYLYVYNNGTVLYWALATVIAPNGTNDTSTTSYMRAAATPLEQTPPLNGYSYNAGGSGAVALSLVGSNPVGGTPGALALTFTIGGTLAGQNIAQFTTATPGVTTGTTTPASVTGAPTVEFAAPTQTRVLLSKTSGDPLYTLAETQFGGTGGGALYIPDSAPIESDNVLIYMCDTRAQLDAINPDDGNNSLILLSVLGHTLGVGTTWNAVYTENRKLNPSNFVGMAPAITFGLTVYRGPESEALKVLQEACVVGKKYFRIAYVCGQWQFWKELKAVRNAVVDRATANELPTRVNPFIAADDPVSVFRVTCIGPAATYFIPS